MNNKNNSIQNVTATAIVHAMNRIVAQQWGPRSQSWTPVLYRSLTDLIFAPSYRFSCQLTNMWIYYISHSEIYLLPSRLSVWLQTARFTVYVGLHFLLNEDKLGWVFASLRSTMLFPNKIFRPLRLIPTGHLSSNGYCHYRLLRMIIDPIC